MTLLSAFILTLAILVASILTLLFVVSLPGIVYELCIYFNKGR